LSRGTRVRIGGLRKADMAIGDLDEGKAPLRRFCRANQPGGRHSTRDRPDDACPGPKHALQGLSTIDAARIFVLADGNVVVTGGSAVDNQLTGINTSALLWKASTGGWTQGAQSTSGIARPYHSVALLLPDGSVLSGGGGAPCPQTNLNAEVYYPPYFFTTAGAFASRPTITSSLGPVTYGQTFTVGVNSAAGIQQVTFIKTASVTHSFNFEQRFMELTFTPNAAGLSVQAPSNAGLAPPGNYLLFVIDSHGVPSVAKIVQIGGS
jgi:hypothetical protein